MTSRTGLVIGAGAALGGAWAVGALRVLADVEGYDPAAADIVVGTSAGSVLAAMIACGVSPDEMATRLSGVGLPAVEGTGPVNPFDVPDHVHDSLGAIPRPVLLPGNLRLAARMAIQPHRHTLMTAAAGLAPRGRGSLTPVGALVDALIAGRPWPVAPQTWLVAMDFDSGRRVPFGRAGSPIVGMADAVMASCSAPGYFPPVTISGRRYVDGGAVSVTNADLLVAEGLAEVLVLAPMTNYEPDHPPRPLAWLERRMRRYCTRRLDVEVARLRAVGTHVRVLGPTAQDLAVMGANVMNPSRRHDVLETSLRTTREQLLAGTVQSGSGEQSHDRAS